MNAVCARLKFLPGPLSTSDCSFNGDCFVETQKFYRCEDEQSNYFSNDRWQRIPGISQSDGIMKTLTQILPQINKLQKLSISAIETFQ
jgi:hypothetical protein